MARIARAANQCHGGGGGGGGGQDVNENHGITFSEENRETAIEISIL
jgi:hypothetical protein